MFSVETKVLLQSYWLDLASGWIIPIPLESAVILADANLSRLLAKCLNLLLNDFVLRIVYEVNYALPERRGFLARWSQKSNPRILEEI